MDSNNPVLGILVGGGPAPGINGVISAATIEAVNHKLDVIGFLDGFKHLMDGSTERIKKLTIEEVSRIHFQGGSILRTSRSNPTKKPEHMARLLGVLERLNVKYLLTIGGDDTAYSSSQVAKAAGGRIGVAHVPKTIDNDLPLPPTIPTFGFQTARHAGVDIVKNLMADAKTSPRWYIVVAMGRSAGHLALGIGKSAAAHVTVIPEEFAGKPVRFDEVCDIIQGAIYKRRARGSDHGVAILAEGLIEHMQEQHVIDVFGADSLERDDHGNIMLDEVPFGIEVRNELRRRFKKLGDKVTLVNKNLGYELRCADPIPYDIEYTRDLGYGAVKFLLAGNSGAVITFHGGVMQPLPFEDETIRNPVTGRFKIRLVDVNGESYQVARKYMFRLDRQDRDDPEKLEKLAAAAKMPVEQFLESFGYLMT